MSKEAMKLALEQRITDYLSAGGLFNPELADHVAVRDLLIDCCKALAEQPAQQEPQIDIYRSFEQWKSGNVLERGVPRTEYYSKAQLDLVEMGWNYGYDAGRAVEQALDKKAENARELGLDYEPAQQEPVAWKWQQAPVKTQWGDDMVVASVAIDKDHTVCLYCERDQAPKVETMFAQRTWVGLTDEEIKELYGDDDNFRMTKKYVIAFARALEAKLRRKNEDRN